jgi:hypothetical protein
VALRQAFRKELIRQLSHSIEQTNIGVFHSIAALSYTWRNLRPRMSQVTRHLAEGEAMYMRPAATSLHLKNGWMPVYRSTPRKGSLARKCGS